MIGSCNVRINSVVAVMLLAFSFSGCKSWNVFDKFTKKSPPQSPLFSTNKSDLTQPIKPEEKINVQMAIARSLENEGQADQAIKVYKEIIKKDNRRADAYHRLAILQDKMGDASS